MIDILVCDSEGIGHDRKESLYKGKCEKCLLLDPT
jgi:hypothetical protein